MHAHTAGDCFLYSTAGFVSYKTIQNIQTHSHSHCHLRVRTLSKGTLLPTFPGFVAVPSGISNCPCPTRQKCRWVVRQLVVTWIQFFHPVAPGPCCLAWCTNQRITLRWFKKHTIHEWYLDTFRAIIFFLMVAGMQIPRMVAWVIFQDIKIKWLFVWNPTL